MSSIADHGLLSDCCGSALVDRTGRIDWCCLPRFDSDAMFVGLLDPDGGHWSITTSAPATTSRRYLPGTMVHELSFVTATGTAVVTDALILGPGEPHDMGRVAPHRLVRTVEVRRGRVEVFVELRPRIDFGRLPAQLRIESGVVLGDHVNCVINGACFVLADEATAAHVLVDLAEGERLEMALTAGSVVPDPSSIAGELAATVSVWQAWSVEHGNYDGAYADLVRRSALVLQALTYRPSGAIVAAPTTSLPEIPGGTSNWDYRFAWLRDASITVEALSIATCVTESEQFLAWMAGAAAVGDDDARLQIVFGVEGERRLDERELQHLAGFEGARPVRTGNDAWQQRQLDVAGEVLRAAAIIDRDGGTFDARTQGFLRALADAAAEQWELPDSGIWEGREGERHYTTSKVLSWAALDHAIRLAPRLGDDIDTTHWEVEAGRIRAVVLERAWHAEIGAYMGALDSDRLDASVLMLPLVGFLPADDERMRASIELIDRRLGDDGLLVRWASDHDEGAFVICSCWLADCYARMGELDRARHVLDRVVAHANDLGLLSEEIDLRTGALLGNFPQGLSHAGLITAAASIDRAERAAIAAGVYRRPG